MSTSTDKPLRADALRNRQRVLEAARTCFATQGVSAQMDDIASTAGVGVGTVYRHFATKDELLKALAASYFDGQSDAAERACAVTDPWEAFSGFIREAADVLSANRGLSQVISDRPEIMFDAAMAADERRGMFTMLDQLITRAKDAGALRADFELEDVPMIMCSVSSLQVSPKAFKQWRRVLEMLIDGLRAPGSGSLPAHTLRLPRTPPAA
jgi:AcrR family transcriptional regulator